MCVFEAHTLFFIFSFHEMVITEIIPQRQYIKVKSRKDCTFEKYEWILTHCSSEQFGHSFKDFHLRPWNV